MKEKLEDCPSVLDGSGAAGVLLMKENAEEDASAAGAGVEPLMKEKPDGLSSFLSFDDAPLISNPPNIVQGK
jgi:hypothetical protein